MVINRVLWVNKRLLLGAGNARYYLGICGHAKRIFSVTQNSMVVIVVCDIVIDDTCEEAQRCLNTKCSFNQATPVTLTRQFGRAIKENFGKLPIEDNWPGLVDRIEQLLVEYPNGGILDKK